MTVALNLENAQAGWTRIDIAGNATAAGQVGEVLNPEGQALHITDAILYIQTGAALTSTFNIGIGATGADVSDLASGLAMDKTDGTVWQIVGKDLASESGLTTPKGVDWGAAEYLSITSAAQVSTDLLAVLLVKYIRLGDLDQ